MGRRPSSALGRGVTRREFLRVSSALSGAALLGCGEGSPLAILPPPSFGPQQSALHGTREEIADEALTVVGGRLPTDMDGHALIIGAVPFGDGTPIIVADAMVTRLSFTPSEVRIKTRLLRTDDFLLDEASATLDTTLAYRTTGLLRSSPQLGARDLVNTALVPVGNGRLIATGDGGRAWEIDPVTLDPITPVGAYAAYVPLVAPSTPGMQLFPLVATTAHPVWDADDAFLYGANYTLPIDAMPMAPLTRILRCDAAHEPTHTDLVDAATGAPVTIVEACHQMATTARFVILLDGASMLDAELAAGGDASGPQRPSTVLWIVPKSELTEGGQANAVRCELPIESAHFVASRDDARDQLEIVVVHQGSSDVGQWIRGSDTVFDTGASVDSRLVGAPACAADLPRFARYVVDARTGAVVTSRSFTDARLWGAALRASDPRAPGALGDAYFTTAGFDPRALTTRIVDAYRDHPSRVVSIADLPASLLPGQLVHFDEASMTLAQSIALPAGWVANSPTFVPRRGAAAGEGYLVTPVLGPEWDEIWVFRADDLAYGPVCRLRHARFDLGLSLHTAWLPELASPRATYRVDGALDYAEGLLAISSDAASLVRRVLAL